MNPETWQHVEQVVQSALELEHADRQAYLEEACTDNPELRAEVESLLQCQEDADNFMGTGAFRIAADTLVPLGGDLQPGQLIDGYKILDLLGEGGMAEVYLAEDATLGRKIAIKVVKRGLNNADVFRRFHHEERILANLNHPQIARFYGGGHTPEGLPYFIMEYIEGLSVIKYCNTHKLSTEDRLKLFRNICSAVDYAHQHLVVHRDLKPSNILVTGAGEARLLDFGIAKLLDAEMTEGVEHTVTMLGAMTPEYASPEQVRGENVTTVTDVYSLGVLLYELLSGHRPYRLKRSRPVEIARVICEQEPTRPSIAVTQTEEIAPDSSKLQRTITPQSVSETRDTQPDKLRRRLSGDLDNIILKALRKDPARRYSSVGQFSEDIRRHLDGLPVIASKDTVIYRTEKFVRRHKFGVAAAAIIFLTLIGGILGTAWQARVAKTQRARAEQRFNDVRRLANSFMFEIHDSVQNLPGSTPTRQLLVTRALEYLNNLAQESHDDPSLQRELVAAYIRIGNVQGNPNNANLGDTAGAMQSYRQALMIAGQLAAANPADGQARRSLGIIREKMADLQSVTGDVAGAVESAQSSLAAFKILADEDPGNAPAQQSLAISYIKVGDVRGNPNFPNNNDRAGSMSSYSSSLAILQSLDKSDPENPKTRRLLGLVYERIGTMHEGDGNVVAARDNYLESQIIRQQLAGSHPENTDAIRDAAIAHEKMGNILAAMGNLPAALESRLKSLEIFGQLAKADPRNVQAQQSLAISYMHLGDLLGSPDSPNMGRRSEARKNYGLAIGILKTLQKSDSTDTKTQKHLDDLNKLVKRI